MRCNCKGCEEIRRHQRFEHAAFILGALAVAVYVAALAGVLL